MTISIQTPVTGEQPLLVARKRHLGRWSTAAVLLVVVALLARSLAANPNLEWSTIGHYLFSGIILEGLVTTIELSLICQVLAMILGVVFAGLAQSPNPILRAISSGYVWFFRATPLLVQLIFWYNLALLFPQLSLGIPFTDLGHSWSTTALISGYSAAVLGLSLNDGAYMAEIVRGGLLSVPPGQTEAAQSIGMRRLQVLTRVTLPQAVKTMIPPTGNQFINLIKATSLVSVIGGGELLTNAQNIYSQNFKVIPLLMVATIWYLALVTVLSVGQHYLERWGRQGSTRRQSGCPQEVACQRGSQAGVLMHVTEQPPVASAVERPMNSSVEPMVRIRGVHKRFGQVEVLRGIDLDIAPGTTTCLLGPSGSGKTTLLRCINHLERVDAGQIFVDGQQVGYNVRGGELHEQSDKEIALARRRTGMVFQQFNLFPHRTALENVMEGPVRVLRQDRGEGRARAMELLEQVGLADRMHHYPAHLSGGQQQRVGIARALAMEPKVLLFDEPTSALDPELVGEVLDVIRRLDGRTMVIVTHEIGFARECSDTIVFMDGGSVVESGPPQEVLTNPKSPRAANFLRRVL